MTHWQLEPRLTPAPWLNIALPALALILTFLTSMLLFWVMGQAPWATAKAIFVDPLFDSYSRSELLVKASPLILIALGLAIGFRANVWNIGAEGQFIMGAIGATAMMTVFHPEGGWLLLPLMALAGVVFGWAWAMIPAILKTRFGASEILVSLMLVYVADLILYVVVSGPLQDPLGFGFPKSRSFQEDALLPIILAPRVNIGIVISFLLAIVFAVVLRRHRFGLNIRVSGLAPRAANYSGVNAKKIIILAMGISGALAGLAGMFEVAGPVGQLADSFATGYGFTAIIVAFLGRLNPLGIVVAAMMISVTYIGGETAATFMRLPITAVQVVQGLLLFFLLSVEIFGRYRLRKVKG